jgi:hypothetical protein
MCTLLPFVRLCVRPCVRFLVRNFVPATVEFFFYSHEICDRGSSKDIVKQAHFSWKSNISIILEGTRTLYIS